MKNILFINVLLMAVLSSTSIFARHHVNQQISAGFSSSGFSSSGFSSSGFSSSFSVPRANYSWLKNRTNYVPYNAIIGGGEPGRHEPLFICRAKYNGGIHPGKVVDGRCNIAWGGREIVLSRYEVMTGDNRQTHWQPAQNGFIPHRAVAAGFEDGHPLYICQAIYRDGMHPGKVVKNSCNIAWGGKEILMSHYNVLVS